MSLISLSDKFVVFGSTGMVGSSICRALKASGYNKILMPKRNELDLLNYSDVKDWFDLNNPKIVIIAAAKVGGIFANKTQTADFILENLKIQTNIIESAWRHGVKKLLFLGSSCIYPRNASQPIVEEELLNGFLEETNESYAIAKISGIKLCQALYEQYGFNAISLMPTNLYGPGDNYHHLNSHVLAALVRRFTNAKLNGEKEVICWGTGNPLREFLHVNDLAQACIFVLENWDLNSKSSPKYSTGKPLTFINVGTGKDISINELAKKISKFVSFKGIIKWDHSKPDGTYRKKLDISRLNKMGWHSKISLNEGLKETINNFKQEIL